MLLSRGMMGLRPAPRAIEIETPRRRWQESCCLTRRRRRRSSIAAGAATRDDASTSTSTSASSPGGGGRLFSNLDDDLKHSPGSVLDAAALVAGTTIGAGVLAIPAVTEPAGFGAAAPALLGAWLFSVSSGLLLAEASLSFLCSTGRGGGSLLSLTRDYLGVGPSRVAGLCYVFLHEALLVAYISRGAEVLSSLDLGSLSSSSSSASNSFSNLPLPLSAVLFTAVLGTACYALPAKKLDEANSVLVAGVIVSFVALLAVALGSSSASSTSSSSSSAFALDLHALARADWGQLPPALPVLALAFVFQNTVSVVVSSLEGDAQKVRTAIVGGTLLPLLMFLAWDAASLGSGGSGGIGSGIGGGAIADPVASLSASSPLAGPLVATFSMLALVTSFFGFVLGLTDFLADALPTERATKEGGGGEGGEERTFSLRSLLPVNAGGRARAPVPYALTLLPPLAGAVAVPGAFLSALSAAGTYGVMALFGVLPAAVAFVARGRSGGGGGGEEGKEQDISSSSLSSSSPPVTLVPGGNPVIFAVGGVAAAVIVNETVSRVLEAVK